MPSVAPPCANVAIALCADDYGLHQGIDDAVLTLLARRRLSAVSCMSGAPRWLGQCAPRLREHTDVDVGLHLNLTEGFGAPGTSLNRVLARAYAHRFDATALRTALARQFDAFEAGARRGPDFVDGHQHVHQLPQIRDVLLELVARRYGARAPWVRNTVPAPGVVGLKPQILRALGGSALARALRRRAIPTNADFGGVYGFDAENYAARFDHWLAQAQTGTLIMCHPAQRYDRHDPIGAQRAVEFAFLDSARFETILVARKVRIAALSTVLSMPPRNKEFDVGVDNIR